MSDGTLFLLAMFGVAAGAGVLGAIFGLAHGIEVERKVKRTPIGLGEEVAE